MHTMRSESPVTDATNDVDAALSVDLVSSSNAEMSEIEIKYAFLYPIKHITQ